MSSFLIICNSLNKPYIHVSIDVDIYIIKGDTFYVINLFYLKLFEDTRKI